MTQGNLLGFTRDDPEFGTFEDAYTHLLALTNEDDDELFGLWTGQDDGGELLAIGYRGEVFEK